MKNSDPKPPLERNAPDTEQESWKQVLLNVRELALKKSTRMLDQSDVDEDVFGRDARDLRSLMSVAEISARLIQFEVKDQTADGEEDDRRDYSEADLDRLYADARAAIERNLAIEAGHESGTAAGNPEADEAGGAA